MIHTTRASLLSSTRTLRYSSYKYLHPLLRNLSTAAANPPTGNSSDHTGYVNGDQLLGGFQNNSYGQSLNPEHGQNPNGFYQDGSYGESRQLFNQRHQNWQSSDGIATSSYGNGNVIPQENAGLVRSQTSQSWDSYNGGQSQAWKNPNVDELQVESHYQGRAQRTDSDAIGSLERLDAICREGKVKEAVDIIKSWRNEGYIVDLPRLLWLAQLCGDAQALPEAKVVHEFITCVVPLPDITTYKLIIEMYSACGSVEDALTVFNTMPEKNSETWCAIIRCFAKNGHGEYAIEMFSRFKEEGNTLDGEIFKEIFFMCGVLGDIDEGLLHFESMTKDYGIIPSVEHYVSLIKMLAGAGYLDEALGFVESMEPNVELWETLMNLSRVHGDLELGDRCQDMVEKLDASRLNKESKVGLIPVNSSDLAKEKMQRMAKRSSFKLGQMAAGDISRPENREYYMVLKSLKEHMVETGYVPHTNLVLHDVDPESKDENLFNHADKFAFIVQLLNTPARSRVKVTKNFRACIDCHNALKSMSKITGRLMVLRDTKKFHHMENGVCTCMDYW